MLIQEYADQTWHEEDAEKRWASPGSALPQPQEALPSARESAQWLENAAAAQWAGADVASGDVSAMLSPGVAAQGVTSDVAVAEVPI